MRAAEQVSGGTWTAIDAGYFKKAPFSNLDGDVAEPKAVTVKPEQFLNQQVISQLDQQGYSSQLFGQ